MPVQSLWFPKQYWGKKDALRWALDHGFRADFGVDSSATGTIKIRQRPPAPSKLNYYSKTVWGSTLRVDGTSASGPVHLVIYGAAPRGLEGTHAADVAARISSIRANYPQLRHIDQVQKALAEKEIMEKRRLRPLTDEEVEELSEVLGVYPRQGAPGVSVPRAPVYKRPFRPHAYRPQAPSTALAPQRFPIEFYRWNPYTSAVPGQYRPPYLRELTPQELAHNRFLAGDTTSIYAKPKTNQAPGPAQTPNPAVPPGSAQIASLGFKPLTLTDQQKRDILGWNRKKGRTKAP